MKIETRNLSVRPFGLCNLSDVYEYMSDPETTYYLPEGTFSYEQVESFLVSNSKAFAVQLKTRGKVVGHIEFFACFGDHTYEIGWCFNRMYHGQGFAFEAASAVLKYGFCELKLHRVIATAQPENTASNRLMEKLGMIREGHFRQCIPKGGGIWWDEYLYSMLKTDFNACYSGP